MSAASAGTLQPLEDALPGRSSSERPGSNLLPGRVRSHQRQVKAAGLQESLLNAADVTSHSRHSPEQALDSWLTTPFVLSV